MKKGRGNEVDPNSINQYVTFDRRKKFINPESRAIQTICSSFTATSRRDVLMISTLLFGDYRYTDIAAK